MEHLCLVDFRGHVGAIYIYIYIHEDSKASHARPIMVNPASAFQVLLEDDPQTSTWMCSNMWKNTATC